MTLYLEKAKLVKWLKQSEGDYLYLLELIETGCFDWQPESE